ncbi:MAG TPA: PP2C family serine/threonine-protein phosphatase [Bryobacteraceae bacterium]|nr:PP2C family serine/threonine-protein phosphatase [Bryobacteraceae bacterium]
MASEHPVADWRVLGASVQGSSHVKLGTGCQDAHGYRRLACGTVVMAIADGAGSACCSAEGAVVAVQTGLSSLAVALASGDGGISMECTIRQAFAHTAVSLAELAGRTPERSIGDYATTLSLVVLSADQIGIGQIGDGAVVAATADGAFRTLTRDSRGEYLNETHFVTEPQYGTELYVAVEPAAAITGIVAMTDGMEILAVNHSDNTPHHPFFTPLLRFVRSEAAAEAELAAFLASERVCARTDDDKTLVIAVRLE